MILSMLLSVLLLASSANPKLVKRNMVSKKYCRSAGISNLRILKEMLDLDYEEMFNLAMRSMDQFFTETPINDWNMMTTAKRQYKNVMKVLK